MEFFILFIFGLIIGSFLNVCISRIPRGESIVFPPSRCEACGTNLKPFDLVPVASFLLLRGKCRYCGCRLSWRYPGIEVLTGVLFILLYQNFGVAKNLIPALFLISLLIIVSFIDMDHYRIPDLLIIFGLGTGIVFQILIPSIRFSDSLLGLIVGGGILFTLALVSRGGMGGGDIKLGGLIGFFLGWRFILLSLFLAALLASIIGLALMLVKKKSRKDPIPFGPFLSLGAIISVLWGNDLILWYVNSFFQ
ncbi:prepilin peptidase [Candidatus Formimonas warabiya]|uniref:Prepilin peptidase n=1 Tax=Formimonas warabiya TaxID=1761012 RepID=A0A3G1KNE9_FORW1|nr:A24 family peptidase [Candidatus Formimonas warabiya]ATW23992.1 prepilin peptidase [Candidatus Formimonas warabiya]